MRDLKLMQLWLIFAGLPFFFFFFPNAEVHHNMLEQYTRQPYIQRTATEGNLSVLTSYSQELLLLNWIEFCF